MGVQIVHYGVDDCHRVPVLKFAGYSISDCRSIAQLNAALQSTQEPGAVVMTEIEALAPKRAVWIARSTSAAPLVLFPGRSSSILEPEFDLVIPALTPPEQWLSDVAELIDRCFMLRARSNAPVTEAASLREEASRASDKSQQEQMRSRARCAKKPEIRSAAAEKDEPG